MALPKLTVLMSVYNSDRTLSEAIDSILEQTYSNFIFVIYDDASKDGSLAILESYRDPRIEVRKRSKNSGLADNLADGVSKISSNYIARMDADDIAFPERFAEQIAYLDAHPEIDVLGTNVVFFDDFGNEFLGIQPAEHEAIALELFFGFTMMHPTIMMRTASLRRGNFNYDPRFVYSQDFDLWTRMLPSSQFANLQIPLLKLREHPNKVSRAKRMTQQAYTNEIRARQVGRILRDASEAELQVFSVAARGDEFHDSDDLLRLERFLVRLVNENRQNSVYPTQPFERAAALFFRSVCRKLLIARDLTGTRYWRSTLRPLAPPMSLREHVAMTARTACARLFSSPSTKR